MSTERVSLKFPVGRMVVGSLYKASDKDAEGKPLVFKNGPQAGQPRVNYFFGVAIKKGAETHWSQTEWGQTIVRVGYTAFPQAAASPAFAWKIEDGDSTIPNKKGRKPCDQEGFAGHWIVKFSGGMAPKVYTVENGKVTPVLQEDFIKPGYFIEAYGNIDGNKSQSQPGVYINHSMVCFRGFGPEIVFGPNPDEVGFGASPLPAGATLTPPPSAVPMPAVAPVAVPVPLSVPVIPGMPAPATAFVPPAVVAPPVAVQPNPGFLQVPVVPPVAVPPVTVAGPVPVAIPSPAVAAPAPPIASVPPASPSSALKMTALANGLSYEAYKAANWSDAQMIAAGVATF